jgi:hypothetical protein
MRHFTTEECIDFVNEVISSNRKAEMRKHLEEGCKRCSRAVLLWQRAARIAKGNAKLEPPKDAVRVAKAAFAAANLRRSQARAGSFADLVFDSFSQSAAEGTRSLGAESRQMLYSAGPYQVTLQIETTPGRSSLAITGQLLNSRYPDNGCRNASVSISNLRGQVVRTLTNHHGEFREEIEGTGELLLVVTGPNANPLIISLTDALGKRSNPIY